MDGGVIRWVVTDERGGQRYTHYDCERRLKSAINAVERWFWRTIKTRPTWDEAQMNELQLRDLRYMLGDLQRNVETIGRELDRIEGVDRRSERIRALREVAGRTPEEAAAYLAKAAELERAQ